MKRLMMLVMLATGGAFADEASKIAKVEQLLQLTNTEQLMKQQLQQMRAAMEAQLPKVEDLALAEKQKEATTKIMDLLEKRLSWERMKAGIVKLYVEMFSEQEIEGINGFYESPAGKAMLSKMPALMRRSMQMGMDLMGDTQAEVKKIIEEVVKK